MVGPGLTWMRKLSFCCISADRIVLKRPDVDSEEEESSDGAVVTEREDEEGDSDNAGPCQAATGVVGRLRFGCEGY